MSNFAQFAGKLPYASELLGVYQPLLGWKSKQMMLRVETGIIAAAKGLVVSMLNDPRGLYTAQPSTRSPGTVSPDPVAFMYTRVGKYVKHEVKKILATEQRLPTRAEWESILSKNYLEYATSADIAIEDIAKPLAAPPPLKHVTPVEELIVAGAMLWLKDHAPEILPKLFVEKTKTWEVSSKFIDPLASFDPNLQLAVLSPIGIVHLYREYFFELDTFLGPPVGHVWISPGGTVELYEVNTRRTLIEKTMEALTETTSRSELTVTEHDEIADAVKEENQRNIKFGMSASWGTNWGVAHAEASTNFGLDTTSKQSAETTHKHMREQSEKVSSEIRRSFKTTFRTVTETTDTSSRRYVVQNTTDKLINYELRRKMRQVAIQVQHIGTQLCWQTYVDEPGRNLGIAELVHVASPQDLDSGIQPPDSPVFPQPKAVDFAAEFAYEVAKKPDGTISHRDMGDDFRWEEIGGQLWFKSDDAYIVPLREYAAPPPAPDYRLVNATIVSHAPPNLLVAADPEISDEVGGKFTIKLKNVNFDGNPAIQFALRLIWKPDASLLQKAKDQYEQKYNEYIEAKSRKAKEEYVKAVRERIKLASNVPLRPPSELREEERTIIYRQLIRQLMKVGMGQSTQSIPESDRPRLHVISELIRSIFDVDKMLYFVAPEWWMPREISTQQIEYEALPGGPAPGVAIKAVSLTDENRIGWGGVGTKGRSNSYLITEDAQPARLGSSLGWLLQLDGDNHRNAFLNSPWVKAVIPVRPGREEQALNWLQAADIEGDENLGVFYGGKEKEFQGMTIKQVLIALAQKIAENGIKMENTLATETVFEKGFDPLAGGFQAPRPGDNVFDQWIEVLPTDQVVALEYDASAHV